LANPWDDESLKGPYYAEKKRQQAVRVKPATGESRLVSAMDSAWAMADKLRKRNEHVDKATKPLRPLAQGHK